MRRSKTPSVLGFVSMMPAVAGDSAASSAAMSTSPFGQRRDLAHLHAAHRRGRRVRAVRGVGHDDLGAREVAARAVVGADHRDAGELALGAGHRRQRDAGHAGHVLQHFLQLEEACHDALPRRSLRQRVPSQEARQHRERIAGPRVVFHRAGAERVEVRVDAEVELREPRVMPDRLQLRHLGQRRRLPAPECLGHVGGLGCRILRRRAAPRAREFEDQRFGLAHHHGHAAFGRPSARPSARAYDSMSARVRVSVAQTRSASPSSG